MFQIVSFFTCELLFILIWEEFHKHSSHWYSMKVRTADVVHCKGPRAFRFFLTLRDEQNAFTPSREDIPLNEEFSCRRNIRFLHGVLHLSHDPQFGRPASPLSVSIQRRDTALAPSASMSSRRRCTPNVHATAPLDFLSSRLRDSLGFQHSTAHVVDKGVLHQTISAW